MLKLDAPFLLKRLRRNRKTAALRSLIEETVLRPQDLVSPFFLLPGERRRDEIPTLPGVYRLSLDALLKEAEMLHAGGIPAIALFPVTAEEEKDLFATAALREEGLVCNAVKAIKKEIPSLCVITDVALDPYTSHGHDGIADEKGNILNDETVALLCQMALLHAQAGADMVAPSDMMDGRIGAIRRHLDRHHCQDTCILAYAAKYASALYSPFRDALGSQLKFGDKKGYQLNPANIREALLEAKLDEEEGADILMVKPALSYLDVIAKIKAESSLPVCAYQVTGEYAMIMAAHERGMVDADKALWEALISIKRAGADFIFTYAGKRMLSIF